MWKNHIFGASGFTGIDCRAAGFCVDVLGQFEAIATLGQSSVAHEPTYEAVTHDIRVSVVPEYISEQSSPDEMQYMWHYTVCIKNESVGVVQLLSRVWRITDGVGRRQEVRGAGVVGETPIIMPGESYSYTSGCPLATPSGIMAGSYQMAAKDGELFDVVIPTFSLDSPFAVRTLN